MRTIRRLVTVAVAASFLGLVGTESQAGLIRVTNNGTVQTDGTTSVHSFGTVIVGASQPSTNKFSVTNTNQPHQSGNVPAVVSATGNAIVNTGTYPLSEGASQQLIISMSTASAGNQSGTVTVHRNPGSPIPGGTSFRVNSVNYSDLDDKIQVQMQVLDHADPSFAGNADTTSLVLDFGTVNAGDLSFLGFDLFNRVATAGFTAGLDLDSIDATGDTDQFGTTLTPFTALTAGTSLSHLASFLPTHAGSFSALYTLHFSDQDLPGAANYTLTLELKGSALAPEPQSVSTPEPGSITLGLLGLVVAGGARRLRRKPVA